MFVHKWDNRRALEDEEGVALGALGHVICAQAESCASDVFVIDPCNGVVQRRNAAGKTKLVIQNDDLSAPLLATSRAKEFGVEDLFVFDEVSQQVFHFNVSENDFNLERNFPIAGLQVASGMCVVGDHLYICDVAAHTVLVVTVDGDDIGRFGDGPGSGPDQLCAPRGIAANPSTREVFIADTGNHRIQVLGPRGSFLRSWGKPGSATGELLEPRGISVHSKNSVLAVADLGNNRVQGFDTVMLGKVSWVIADRVKSPFAVSFDPDDDILVTDQTGAQWFAPPSEATSSEEDDDSEFDRETATAECKTSTSASRFPVDVVFEGDDEQDDQGYSFTDEEEEEEEMQVRTQADSPQAAMQREHDASCSESGHEYQDEEEEEEEEDDDGNKKLNKSPRSKVMEQARAFVNRNNNMDEEKATELSKGKDNKVSKKVKRRFVRDTLDMKKHVLELRSRVEELEKDHKRLTAVRADQESELGGAENANYGNQAAFLSSYTSNASATNRLDSASTIQACEDALALEERLVELEILCSKMSKARGPLEADVAASEKRALAARRALEKRQEQLDQFPPALRLCTAQLKLRLKEFQTELERLNDSLAHEREAYKAATLDLEARKKNTSKQLSKVAGKLAIARQEACAAEKRIDACRSRKKPVLMQVQNVREQLKALGGRDAVLGAVFAAYGLQTRRTQGQKRMDVAQCLRALKSLEMLELENKNALAALREEDIRAYFKLHGAEGLGLDEQGFRSAYEDAIA